MTALSVPVPALKPRLRGVFHQYSFLVSLVAGPVLVAVSPSLRAQVAAAIYALTLSGLFAASALHHRITWSPRARRWMRRLDHSMIFLLVAGTYTPFALLSLSERLATVVLAVVWAAAFAGALLKLAWIDGPKWVTAIMGAAFGAGGMAIFPHVALSNGLMAVGLLVVGGLLYSVGVAIYMLRRPNPAPAVFGYHEIFHALVIAAAAAHFASIAFFVLPRG